MYGDGSLKFKQITWQNSSNEVLEKICTYEAVHAVKDKSDLKRRLGPDRRVYALFVENEVNQSNEPLVFIHVALVPELSNSIQNILNADEVLVPEEKELFKYAICYSITTQKGLGGIDLERFNILDQKELKAPLMRLCTRYILDEKRSNRKHALDPVANFHLKNGACVHRIQWQADTSNKSRQQSFGIMINYNYVLHSLELHQCSYKESGKICIT
ncbi:MAG: malonyl-CoA decarboxylase [Benjaminiella poitrasii]|nr:MAG: malonyl-CoA decarboxylase [Benjaminiella poitrasii]